MIPRNYADQNVVCYITVPVCTYEREYRCKGQTNSNGTMSLSYAFDFLFFMYLTF